MEQDTLATRCEHGPVSVSLPRELFSPLLLSARVVLSGHYCCVWLALFEEGRRAVAIVAFSAAVPPS